MAGRRGSFYAREMKKWGLKASIAARVHESLAGVVYLITPEGKNYCRIWFSDAFAEAVGKALPYGVTVETPAFIKVVFLPSREVWQVFAKYLHAKQQQLLWETQEKPCWVRVHRRGKHGPRSENTKSSADNPNSRGR